jgi:hypothetical protein
MNHETCNHAVPSNFRFVLSTTPMSWNPREYKVINVNRNESQLTEYLNINLSACLCWHNIMITMTDTTNIMITMIDTTNIMITMIDTTHIKITMIDTTNIMITMTSVIVIIIFDCLFFIGPLI